jgi:hypothetical protein
MNLINVIMKVQQWPIQSKKETLNNIFLIKDIIVSKSKMIIDKAKQKKMTS